MYPAAPPTSQQERFPPYHLLPTSHFNGKSSVDDWKQNVLRLTHQSAGPNQPVAARWESRTKNTFTLLSGLWRSFRKSDRVFFIRKYRFVQSLGGRNGQMDFNNHLTLRDSTRTRNRLHSASQHGCAQLGESLATYCIVWYTETPSGESSIFYHKASLRWVVLCQMEGQVMSIGGQREDIERTGRICT
jgi:hypothetical protein